MKIPATVSILTFNSAETLPRALESVKDFAEILINDGGSTDDTLAIAASYGARILSQDISCKNSDGTIADFSCVRNQCLHEASYDWFLYIDSDEAVSHELVIEIEQYIKKVNVATICKVPIRIFIDAREIKHSSNYPGYQTRFFNRKTGAYFIKQVHERITCSDNTPVHTLRAPWCVFMTPYEATHYYQENKKYLLMQAQKKRSFFDYMHKNVVVLLINTAKIFIKTARNYIFFGYAKSMPWSVEWGRMKYQLGLIYHALRFWLQRRTK